MKGTLMSFHLNLASCKNALKLNITLSPDHGHDFPKPKAFMSCSLHWRGNRVLLLSASVFKILLRTQKPKKEPKKSPV